MIFFDYHTHSNYSFDSTEDLENNCKAAIEKNVSELAFTEHYDCNYENNILPDLESYNNSFLLMKEKYKDRLKIKLGIEIGQAYEAPEKFRFCISALKYDVVLASLHNLPGREDFYFIDYAKESREDLLSEYFNILYDVAKNADYDILAHLDYPLRYMGKSYENALSEQYRDITAEILKAVIDRGKIIEVNTSNFDKGLNRTMPSPELIKLYRDLGGKAVSTGSDAHTSDRIAANFDEVYCQLKNFGIKYIASYENRILKPISL